MTTTVDKLAALPTLAARTTNANSDPGSHVPVKTQPGSKPPPGVNLDAIDNHQGRNHPALLRQLTRCIHMCQSRMTSTEWRQSPDLDPAPTWTTETRWLITTAPWWVGNQDARDLIITISDDLTSRLTSLWEATVDYKICGACGTPTQERQSDNLALCECPACERVLWRFAYLYRHDLPIHPAYAMSFGGALDRRWIRVSAVGGERGAEKARADWEEYYYPEIVARGTAMR